MQPVQTEGASQTPIARGAAMDRRVERKFPAWVSPAAVALAVVVGAAATFVALSPSGRTIRIESDKLTISAVARGQFEDYIPIRGRVEPARTLFLDAIEGGRVENVLVEDGARVRAGDLLVRLSNTSLQLDVLAREAEVVEQLNVVRTQELQLERNRLDHKRNLVEIKYNIKRLQRLLKRQLKVHAQGHLATVELEQTRDELEYWKQRRGVTKEAQSSDERLQRAQVDQLRAAADRLKKNLAVAQSNLEGLNVRAPTDGKLTSLNAEIGQSLARGERIGRIDAPDSFKVVALIDEFYLPRVTIGQTAAFSLAERDYVVASRKIYPQVRNGQFEVDFFFDGEPPVNIRRGQTLQARLSLGDPTPSLLVPNGAFFQDTGGHWMFVLSDNTEFAIRRTVKLGRRNLRFIEVLEGLEEGERVVTSPYTNFLDTDRLELAQHRTSELAR